MSLRVAVAAPFKRESQKRMREQAFVVDLAMDRDWLSPDQAKRLADLGVERGLLRKIDGELEATFDLEAVEIPEGFVPEESIFESRSPFESILDTLVSGGRERQQVVAGINSLQDELLVTADAAAVLYARQHGVVVDEDADRAADALRQ